MNAGLRSIELAWRAVNRIRRGCYRYGILHAKRLDRPVISVGNISAGGSGKTPAVITIARHLASRGLHVVVLTRGFGRSGEGGVLDNLDADRFGDEPVVIKKSVPDASVVVGKNRYDNASRIKGDVYLLDDGFQHLQLARDLDVVIDTPSSGLYREGRSALRHADIVIPRRVRPANLDALRGHRVFAFSGLADNEQFFAMLRAAGVELTGTRAFPDHHQYSEADLTQIRTAGRGADVIATTEKDGVKLRAPDFVTVPIDFEIEPEVLERITAVARR